MTNRTDSTGGIYTGTAYGDKTFYGFKLDHDTGDCTIEIINDGSPVVLPDQIYGEIQGGANDYKSHFWSIDTIEFEINPNTGHLQMKFLS